MSKQKQGLTRQGVPDLGHKQNKRHRNFENERLIQPQKFGDERDEDSYDLWLLMIGESKR